MVPVASEAALLGMGVLGFNLASFDDMAPMVNAYKDAIGNADTLAAALEFQDGFSDDVEQDSGSVSVKKEGRIDVQVTLTPSQPRYAEPVPGQ